MKYQSTIKWRPVWINIWIVGLVYIFLLVVESQFFGTSYTSWVFGLFLIAYGLQYSIRTRVPHFFALYFVLGTGFWHTPLVFEYQTILTNLTLFIHLILFLGMIPLTFPVIVRTYKMEINARKLFKLAAEQLTDTDKGFTNRPFSFIALDGTCDEFLGFSRFLESIDVVKSKITDKKIVFGFSMGRSPVVTNDIAKISHIVCQNNGKLSISISKHDYDMYKKAYSFDQLCSSLGFVFECFMSYYKEGREERIINEIKTA